MPRLFHLATEDGNPWHAMWLGFWRAVRLQMAPYVGKKKIGWKNRPGFEMCCPNIRIWLGPGEVWSERYQIDGKAPQYILFDGIVFIKGMVVRKYFRRRTIVVEKCFHIVRDWRGGPANCVGPRYLMHNHCCFERPTRSNFALRQSRGRDAIVLPFLINRLHHLCYEIKYIRKTDFVEFKGVFNFHNNLHHRHHLELLTRSIKWASG